MESDFDCQDGEWALLPEQHGRTVLHIDIDCFYAQVEMVRNPDLQGKPVGIKQKNIMITCNYTARSLGVKKSMFVTEAQKLLPDIILVDGSDLTHYRQFSADITKIAQEFSPSVERLGLDENFIDVSDKVSEYPDSCIEICGHYYGDKKGNTMPKVDSCGCGCFERLIIGSHIARELRKTILERTGITCCAGIAHNKLIAKLIAGYHKPNDQTVIFPWQVQNLMSELKSVKSIPGIGSVTSKSLSELNISSVEELQTVPLIVLSSKFDIETCKRLKNLSFGIDESQVHGSILPQSIGLEDAFKEVTLFEQVKIKYQVLLDRLLKLLASDGRQPAALKVSVRRFDLSKSYGHRETKQVSISPSFFSKGVSNVSENIKTALMDIISSTFQKMVDIRKPFHLTMVALGFTKFVNRVPDSKSITHFFQKRYDELKEEEPEVGKCKLSKDNGFPLDVNEKIKQEAYASEQEGSGQEMHVASDLQEKPSNSCSRAPNLSGEILKSTCTVSSPYHCQKKYRANSKSACGDEGLQRASVKTFDLSHMKEEIASREMNIPSEIDKDVFNALPASLQEEILQSYKDTQHVTHESFVRSVEICPNSSKTQECCTVEKYFLPVKNNSKGNETSDNIFNSECEKLEPSDKEVASCSSVNVKVREIKSLGSCDGSRDIYNKHEFGSEFPNGIDISVFRELPEDIQNEILRENKEKKQELNSTKAFTKATSSKRKSGSSPSILKYLKKY